MQITSVAHLMPSGGASTPSKANIAWSSTSACGPIPDIGHAEQFVRDGATSRHLGVSSLSVHFLYLTWSPGLVEERLQRTVEPQDHDSNLCRATSEPNWPLVPDGGFGPKYTSTEVSGLITTPFFWLPMLGNCWSVWSIERVWLS